MIVVAEQEAQLRHEIRLAHVASLWKLRVP
ncbi:MAG: hypothetical protein BWY17_03586 [Deltaproteobacteria bacterium ADurb.Bin207]|jgi:hypothetical protein|nr:MAG: hypothetical protein BWY17_03586 [Deltaproteobacteria bacterium ADurb.Bin207]